MNNKEKIVNLFLTNVIGRKPDLSGYKKSHDGKVGHWLEKQMGVKQNSDNLPDLYGYEMKNHTSSKTTFGDWSASHYIFKKGILFQGITRNEFFIFFGKANPKKNNRLSWCATAPRKVNIVNNYGQIMLIEQDGIKIFYRYDDDQRENKNIIPEKFKSSQICIAFWEHSRLKEKVEAKFNQNGWFKCLMNDQGIYTELIFGHPLTYNIWLDLLRKNLIFFDTAMYQGNVRPYSQWRCNNDLFESMAYEKYVSTIPIKI